MILTVDQFDTGGVCGWRGGVRVAATHSISPHAACHANLGGALTWGALTCEGGGAWNRGGSCHAFQSARGWQLVHINILDYYLLLSFYYY